MKTRLACRQCGFIMELQGGLQVISCLCPACGPDQWLVDGGLPPMHKASEATLVYIQAAAEGSPLVVGTPGP